MTIWKRLLWPLLWAAATLCVAKDCSNHIVGVEGEDIVLSPSVAGSGNLTRIYWKKGENIVANSWFSFPPGKKKQRLSLDSSSGKLILKNLSKEDTGNYTAEVFINEKIEETCFDLKILVWPDINCTINNGTIQLSCTSPSQDLPLTYSWENIRNEEISEKGSVVLLQRNPSHFQKITCYVIAFGSNASTSINLSDCIPVEEPDHQSRSRIHLIAIPIILVLILVLFFCIKKYLKKKKESKILNESESGAKNARGNCKEESSELPEEERKALKFELKSVGKKEKSEETSMLES
ncbi:lymphocyte function-associated antigen 3 isoform X2 [Pituophis catenifer annectens]|uniref:lymphocyte function-associated antigen 3 isoform X2 n=1 Tax=Pituophis catenifer annectens TaxID=94852 RepID=UPI003994DE65